MNNIHNFAEYKINAIANVVAIYHFKLFKTYDCSFLKFLKFIFKCTTFKDNLIHFNENLLHFKS